MTFVLEARFETDHPFNGFPRIWGPFSSRDAAERVATVLAGRKEIVSVSIMENEKAVNRAKRTS